VIGSVPDQVPGSAVRLLPSWAVPLMLGGVWFEGGTATLSTTSSGAWFALLSRLASSIGDREVESSFMLMRPLPVTSGVTSTDTHSPAENEPLEATTAEPGGALSHVISFSSQELSDTPWTSKPTGLPSSA
jgi:hypothetical protein